MAATAAVMTRYVAAVLLFIPASMILIQFIKRFNLKYFLLTFLSVLLLTVPHFLIRKTDPAAFLHHPWLESWSLKNFFRTSFDTPDGHAGYTFPNIIYSFFNWIHPGYIFAGAFLVLLFRKKNIVSPGGRIFFAPVLLYSLFLAGIPLQNLRFLQLSFPVILILFFPLAIESSNYFGARIKKAALISFVVVIQLILFVRAFIPFYRYNHMEKEMAKEIKKYPVNTIYIFEMEGALKSYHVKNKIVGLWNQKLDSVESHSLLLFNPQKFESQWRGTNVMLNYEMIGQQKKIRLLKTFDHGWQLSELE